ncbi:MAG: mechanosensitive ion channel family protein [Spirochaetaceae bacterium]|nr:mechanosensitive ion channel family protein [Spirochaetaceae bacterium]HPG25764.1 mechanosensitive ion channel [Myxococcota bacterium]
MTTIEEWLPGDALDVWLPALIDVGLLVLAVVVGWIGYRILFSLLRRAATQAAKPLALRIVDQMRPGARLLGPMLAMRAVMPALASLPGVARDVVHHALVVLGIAAATWLLVGVARAIASFLRETHDIGAEDNLAARRVVTQVNVLERTAEVMIVLFGIGAALLTLPGVREVGTGLLASAGVVGLVVGLAARPLLENLIAGVQLALTQPIRMDDVVIVRGEWGRIEEITTTYVVVRIWDERRLVVPFSTFIQQPFENWTRRSAELIGTVFLWADYRIDVAAAREALEAIVRETPLWDGRVCNVQVTDTTEHAVQLRALLSAADSSTAWDLRVYVRERWLAWLQRHQPEALPRARVELEDPRTSADRASESHGPRDGGMLGAPPP